MGEGEPVTGLGGVGELGGITLTQGGVDSNCDDWESMTGGLESIVDGADEDSSIISNSMGMSE